MSIFFRTDRGVVFVKSKKRFRRIRRIVTIGVTFVQVTISAILGIQLLNMNLLPTEYLIFFAGFLFCFNGLVLIMSRKKVTFYMVCTLSLILSGVMIYATSALDMVHDTLEQVTGEPDKVKTEYVVIVLNEEEAGTVTDYSHYYVAYMDTEPEKDIGQVIGEMQNKVDEEIRFREYRDVIAMVEALYENSVNAMIVNKAYVETIGELDGYADFSERTKVLYTSEVINYITLDENKESNLEQFIVYISGIDTYGDVSIKSRSDVNILAVVNMETKTVQLINTPRDYYVPLPISNGVEDKLTHAGIYGVDVSMGTLEELYDIEIDYFVRMNFSGFEAIIDAMGGIDVYSEYTFTSDQGTYHTKGMNHMNGFEALAFARERQAFSAGDIQRGKHQMAIISAMIEKLSSTEVLYHYADVLEAVSGAFQTSFTSEEIYELVKAQLEDSRPWTIETYYVTGTGKRAVTYSMPNTPVSVKIPNMETVEEAKELIKRVLEGK